MNRLARLGPWIPGIALCTCGVLLVRVPQGGGSAWILTAFGYALAGAGLLRIAMGVRQRIEDDEKASRH